MYLCFSVRYLYMCGHVKTVNTYVYGQEYILFKYIEIHGLANGTASGHHLLQTLSYSPFTNIFLYFILSVRLLSVLRGHSFFSSPLQRPTTSDFEGFLYQILWPFLYCFLKHHTRPVIQTNIPQVLLMLNRLFHFVVKYVNPFNLIESTFKSWILYRVKLVL